MSFFFLVCDIWFWIRLHPELAGSIIHASMPFPDADALLSRRFEAVILIGAIIHIPDQRLFEFASQIRDLVVPEGFLFAVSVSQAPRPSRPPPGETERNSLPSGKRIDIFRTKSLMDDKSIFVARIVFHAIP